jgi:hypothetical protein
MTRRTLTAAFVLALPLSSLLVACGRGEDTADRTALEREALQRDLDLALQPDTTPEVALGDVALLDSVAGPAPAPAAGAPRTPAPAPARTQPRASTPSASAPAPSRPAEPAGPRYVTRTAPSGSTFSVRFDEQVSTRQSVGSTFTATLTESLTDASGNTVIPAGATVYGTVTRSTVGHRSGEGADIGVTFTSIESGGERYPIDVSMVSSPAVRRMNRQGRGQTAATVAGGAAVGAVAGRVLGRSRRATVAGAVIGGAAGTAVAVTTADVDAVISAGTSATARLDGPVRVRREVS